MTQLTIARCRRHSWLTVEGLTWCARCGAEETPKVKRGRTVREYGNRAELAVARTYGGAKIGHHGRPRRRRGPRLGSTQVRTRRAAVPAEWSKAFAAMSVRPDKLPRLLLRFVRPGNAGPEDYLVIRARDWLDWFGRDE